MAFRCAGVPIVGCDAGGIPEAAPDGFNGVLVPPGAVEALQAAIGKRLRDPSLAQPMGQAGRVLMRTELSTAVMVEGNRAVYRELLAAHG